MANIQDYLKWRGDLSFSKFSFNEVDNLILSELSYLNIDKLMLSKTKTTIAEAINYYLEKKSVDQLAKMFPLSENPYYFFQELASSNRFKNLKIFNYESHTSKEEEKQFAAMMIEINPFTTYVAFRGTDDTLIGWKEDFNMSFISPIPSQEKAAEYLNKKLPFRYQIIYLGGHSKGGNLAVYAAVKARRSLKRKIRKVYSNDGPGFSEEFITSAEYLNMLPKIETIIPESSIIGMLLAHKGKYKVIKSKAFGLWQHDALSWLVYKDHFIPTENVDETSLKINTLLNNWLKNLTKQDRALFINTIYEILLKSGINTMSDLTKLKIYKIPSLIKNFSQLDSTTRKMIINFLKLLINESKTMFESPNILKTIGFHK